MLCYECQGQFYHLHLVHFSKSSLIILCKANVKDCSLGHVYESHAARISHFYMIMKVKVTKNIFYKSK